MPPNDNNEPLTDTPETGDGVLTIPSEKDGDPMPADLPEGVANHLMTETVGNIQADNRRGRDGATLSTNVLHAVQVRNHDEVGTLEGRAVSGVNATPIASPATQQS